tara:strand:+ start:16698 stop:18161 length:1464 start_codon:yes stop_codon:yes gene_type:complete
MLGLHQKKILTVLCLALGLPLLFFYGCSSTKIDQVKRGAGYQYRPGFPELRMTSSGLLDANDDALITISSEIVYGSLIYKKSDGFFEANASIEIQIKNTDNDSVLAMNNRYVIQIKKENPNIVHSQETYLFEKEFNVSPGNYLVTVSLTDQETGKQTYRSESTFIPNPKNSVKNITNIQILSKRAGNISDTVHAFTPETTYDIPSSIDSLKFVFQVTNNRSDSPLTIYAKLIRFRSDSSIARPMTFGNYYPSSLPYKGIDYDKVEEMSSTRRVLNEPGSVLIEFVFPALERGNYRLEVSSIADDEKEDENTLYKARDFSIKSPNYPALMSTKELAKPLFYLMTEKEYKALMKIEDDDLLKNAIDRFWLSNIKNSITARNVVSLYYARVEEANKQFSSFKEGWKTDAGMIYILFGPPWVVDVRLDEMKWSYSYNLSDPEKNFYFRTPKIKNKYYPFDNYLLLRNSAYYNTQYQQIQLWLSGQILKRSI